MTAEGYQELIIQFIPLLNESEQDCCLQQGDGTAHTVNLTMAMPAESSGDNVIPRIYDHHNHWTDIPSF
jgi:hypothetical protein